MAMVWGCFPARPGGLPSQAGWPDTGEAEVKTIRVLGLMLLVACGLAMACRDPVDPDGPDVPATDTAAAIMAADMGVGVNIGNTLENTYIWETGWGQPLITREYINGMAANGIKTVRLPVAWDTYAVDGVVPADKMARVRQVVQWILDAGMYCIVNIHWDGGWICGYDAQTNTNSHLLTDTIRDKFRSYWEQIATALDDLGTHLIYESMNEEGCFYVNGDSGQGRDYAALNELNQLFVDTVRAQAGTGTAHWNASRCLLISGFSTDIAATCISSFAIPEDPAGTGYLFLSVHYYTPALWCIAEQPVNWGSWLNPRTTWGTTADQTELTGLFDTLDQFCRARGVPAIIGEYGVGKGSGSWVKEPASRTRWFTAVMQASLDRGMVPVLWDTGADVSRSNGALSSDLSQAITGLQ